MHYVDVLRRASVPALQRFIKENPLYDNRPLETLAAFAISFAAGMLSAVALVGYARWAKKRAY